jgi:Icc-related predicted phosphoesterase
LRIQFFSDIHLEFGALILPETDADVIVAAGDVGVGVQGVEWLADLGKPVIYVAGNHEFYAGDLYHTRKLIETAALGSNVHYLENSMVEIEGTRFIGSTLWTDFNRSNSQTMQIANRHMNDFYHIQNRGERLLPEHLVDIHAQSMSYLKQELAKPYTGNTVVVTHHAPCRRSWSNRPDSAIIDAYCSDALERVTGHPLDLWIHGHIHVSSDYQEGQTRVACNPRGYHNIQIIDGFDAARTIDL